MRTSLAIVACLALAFSTRPALALKNIEGCDIVAFISKGSPVAITEAQWLDYRQAVEAALLSEPNAASPNPRALAVGVVAAQKDLLALVKSSPAYQDYLGGNDCRIIAKLDASAVEALLAEAAATMSEDAAKALRDIVAVARMQIDLIERTARFRSNQDRTLFAAQYYCFVVASIAAFLPPERRAELTLEDFGKTVSCKDAGRTG